MIGVGDAGGILGIGEDMAILVAPQSFQGARWLVVLSAGTR